MSKKKCSKCDGMMAAGKLASYGYVTWVKSLWQLRGAKVAAYRCEKCGYVELYVE